MRERKSVGNGPRNAWEDKGAKWGTGEKRQETGLGPHERKKGRNQELECVRGKKAGNRNWEGVRGKKAGNRTRGV